MIVSLRLLIEDASVINPMYRIPLIQDLPRCVGCMATMIAPVIRVASVKNCVARCLVWVGASTVSSEDTTLIIATVMWITKIIL